MNTFNFKKRTKPHHESLFFVFFMFIYVFLSFYEGYISASVGLISRYFLILMLIYLIATTKAIKITFAHISILVWYLYYLSSLFWTSLVGVQRAKIYISTITIMVMIFLLLSTRTYSKQFLTRFILIIQITSASLGIFALFSSEFIANGTRNVLVLFGEYIDPNNQVALFAVGVGISFYNLFFEKKAHKWIDIIILVINTYGIFMTGSRSGIVILLAQTIIILLWKKPEQKVFKYISKWACIILGVIFIIIIAQKYVPTDVFNRIFGLGPLKFTDGTERETAWAIGSEVWKSNPIFGCGWGSHPAHNTFLTFLIDVGIIGSIPFYFTIFKIVQKAYKQKNILAIILIITGLIPSFFIDAQNKRFFWNAFIIPMILMSKKQEDVHEKNYNNAVEKNTK